MADVSQISEFGKILIFLIAGVLLVAITLFLGRLIAPRNPTAGKLSSYECGEEPTGNAWVPFNSRFYVIALVFLLFDVEMVFIFPWATVFGNHAMNAMEPRWGKLALIEMFVFLGILILGLVYVWCKGDLDWIKPNPTVAKTDVQIPASLYEQLNIRQSAYQVKPFTLEQPVAVEEQAPAAPAAATPKKPMFKPTFKKPANES